jgi:hypothetical protein
MVNEKRQEIKDLSDGVPLPVEGEPEIVAVRRAGRWQVLAALWLPLAGCVAEARAEEHSHRFAKTGTDSEECCARWDVTKGRSSDGGEIEIKKCGQWGVRVTVNYSCACGETKSTTMPCT